MSLVTSYSSDFIEKYSKPVPRYTSYPTAPHFDQSVDHNMVGNWLGQLQKGTALSLYIHIPFCDRLCWFCGCHTKHTLKYVPVREYVDKLVKEIAILRQQIGRRQTVAKIHLGGGSPSILREAELAKLRNALDTGFDISPSTEISIEFDPEDISPDMLAPFIDFGVSRASIGVQDFDEKVQEAINRPQSFAQTASIIDMLRKHGVNSLNIDALYGLPHQDMETLRATMNKVLQLQPDRLALFGYAHVPWVKKHQRLIPEAALPSAQERFKQARLAEKLMEDAGYQPIGMDHFAKPDDALASAYRARQVRRNFQGYTTDMNPVLVGLGISSISRYREGYAQNVKDAHSYDRALSRGELPIDRGIGFAGLNMAFGAAIEELMTYFTVSPKSLTTQYGAQARAVIARAHEVAQADEDGLFIAAGNGFAITPRGRPLVRSIAARFDPYLQVKKQRYSQAI